MRPLVLRIPPVLLVLAVALWLPQATAYDEGEAAQHDGRIDAVWHEPAMPPPGTQWHGFIRFVEGHNVTDVRYQICRVGQVCFAQPTLAERVDDNMWTFDTADYKAGRNAVDWGRNHPGDQPGDWRVGVKYYLFTDGQDTDYRNGTLVPTGLALDDPRCVEGGELTWVECDETHYFAFDLTAERAGGNGAPGLPIAGLLVAVVAAAWLVRRERA